ncbi:PIN domain-containing protein [uncultured Lamprocystis sp.]|jgi:predicted nucleic acid-binding protein|uniref:PIN domain-containing protein n=1 Tax=uncultured Lamprocystis sp. TaxID=543132 RepID=UPI0025F63601|nr:PIN domain-containing protein [uncultured Lamprocystis sp.]
MRADAFIDTNVLLYAVSTDAAEAGKRALARQVLGGPGWGLSVQVLQEFYVNVVRPPCGAMTHTDAVAAIRQFLRHPTVASDAALLLDALRLKERFQIAYWDAAIIAAARVLGAGVLYSEDLNHGQDYDGVKVINPFPAH